MTRRRRAIAVLAALGLGSVLTVRPGLRSVADFLVVADPLLLADALYVFPGRVPQRAECAADLFHDGWAPTVVVTGERIRPELVAIGTPISDAEINARILAQGGVPRDAITVLREGTSTREDAEALRGWASTQGSVRSITAVTSPTHSRRAKRTSPSAPPLSKTARTSGSNGVSRWAREQ